MVNDRIRSFPYARTINTSSARPSLASQAARVRIRIMRVLFGVFARVSVSGIAVERRRRAASSASRAVRKCVRWRKTVARVMRVATKRILGVEVVIPRGGVLGWADLGGIFLVNSQMSLF